jgi:uncharacterized protein (DUF1800 family)
MLLSAPRHTPVASSVRETTERATQMTTSSTDIAHLLRRAGFGGTKAQIDELATLDLAQVVDRLLNDAAAWQPGKPARASDPDKSDWERFVALGNWWFDQMAGAPVPLVEKTTLFWHGHLTSAYDKVPYTEYLWRLNATQRAYALGNIRTMVQRCVIEPAMLFYLDNAYNVKSAPNQNFAREVLELFLLGVGTFSETDVESCARAWSGHNVNVTTEQYKFYPDQHDNGMKTFLGVTKNWDGPQIIDFLFDDPKYRVQVARFFSAKLWSFFAHPNPPAGVVTDLANVMYANNFEMKPVLRALFLRPEFYEQTTKQGLVRSPIEYLVSIMRASGLRSAEAEPMMFTAGLGQEPFNPPNVSGWRPNRYWLSTGAADAKVSWASRMTWQLSDQHRDIFHDIPSLPIPQAIDEALSRIGITEVSANSKTAVTAWLTEQRAALYDGWYEPLGLSIFMLLLPELQLA